MVGFIGYNVVFGIGPEVDHDYVLATGTGGNLARLLRERGHHAVAADEAPADEAPTLEDGALSSATVLNTSHVQRELRRMGCRALVPFKSNARLLRVAGELGIDILAAPAQLVRQLENKLTLAGIAESADVRLPETRTVRVDDSLRDELGALGGRAMFQPAVSFAGAGTTLLQGDDDVAALRARREGTVGKLAQFVDGEPLSAIGVVLPGSAHDTNGRVHADVLVDEPTRQLTGISSLTPHPFGACGNDWSLPLASDDAQAVRELTARVGIAISARGFRGAYGVDVVRDPGGEFFLIELNPRWTSGLSLAVQLQQLASPGAPTIFDAHLLAYGYAGDELRDPLRGRFGRERPAAAGTRCAAASMIVFNAEPAAVEIAPLEPGRYRVDGTGLAFVAHAWRLDQLHDDEVLVLPQPPSRPVAQGVEIARVLVRGRVVADVGARCLLEPAQNVVTQVRARALAAIA